MRSRSTPTAAIATPRQTASGNARVWSFASGVPWVRETMVAHGDPKPLWLSEFGWTSCTDLEDRCVSEATQAAYTRDVWPVIDGWDYVLGATQYQLRDNGSDRSAREGNFGLLRGDLSAKPAYAALVAALRGGPAGAPGGDPAPAGPSRWPFAPARGGCAAP